MDDAEEIAGAMQKYWEILKVPHDAMAKDFLTRCQSCSVKANNKIYKYYRRGSGPTIVLVHGYNNNLGTMVTIAEDLVEQGFKVVLFDAPAHGEASGTQTDPLEVRELIRKIGAQLGEIHAVVGYSLGVLWTLAAWHDAFRVKTMISIAAPSDFKFSVGKFVEMHQVKSEIAEGLAAQIEQRFGVTVWEDFSPSAIAKKIGVPGLIIHGKKDEFIPPFHAEQLHANWPDAKVEMLDDVGHFDIVGSPKVRNIIKTYLQQLQ